MPTASSAPANARRLTRPSPSNGDLDREHDRRWRRRARRRWPCPARTGRRAGCAAGPGTSCPRPRARSPTISAVSTRGRRSSRTIVSADAGQACATGQPRSSCARIAIVSAGETDTVPSAMPATIAIARTIRPADRRADGPAPQRVERAGGRAATRSGASDGRAHVSARRADGLGRGAAGEVGRQRRRSSRSGWMARASEARPSASRGPGRVTRMSSTGADGALLHRRHARPAGPRHHVGRADAVERVADHDDLRVGRDERLDRDREHGRVAGRDRARRRRARSCRR